MSNKTWAKEIEKKYKINDRSQFENLRKTAISAGLRPVWHAIQRDWVPDFANSEMKNNGVLLRIRNIKLINGIGPQWMVTLKKKSVKSGVHHNLELEADSTCPEKIRLIEDELKNLLTKRIELKKLLEADSEYIQSIGLTLNRMLLEKNREEFVSEENHVSLSFDILPEPLGLYIELESDNEKSLSIWEKKLNINNLTVVEMDYGELVKNLDGGNRRILIFE